MRNNGRIPIVSSLEDLYKQITDSYKHKAATHRFQKVYLLLIGGTSRSGKTTLANLISGQLNWQNIKNLVVSLDSWLLGIDERKENSVVVERYETEAIINAVDSILNGHIIYPPIYNPITRKRTSDTGDQGLRIDEGVVIVDGVIALAVPELLNKAGLSIFVDVADKVRLQRLTEFYIQDKGFSPDEANTLIEDREKEEIPFVKKTKKNANIVYCPRQEIRCKDLK